MEEKKVLAAASFDKQKYYIDNQFSAVPDTIKDEVKTICVLLAQKLMCTFVVGFYKDGDVYFDILKGEYAIDFDDIGAELEIKSLMREKKELIRCLKLWYLIYKTPEGERIKQELLSGRDIEEI